MHGRLLVSLSSAVSSTWCPHNPSRLECSQDMTLLSISTQATSNATPTDAHFAGIRVLLPRCLCISSESTLVPLGRPLSTEASCNEAAEGPQTAQKLVLRKRTTSPYQIKLPFMADRLRAPRRPHPTAYSAPNATERSRNSVSDSCTARPESVETELRSSSGPPPTPGPSSPPAAYVTAQRNAPTPVAFLSAFYALENALAANPPGALALDTPPSGLSALRGEGVDDAAGPRSIASFDTWSEICEDISRAMESCAVLSCAPVADGRCASSIPLPCQSSRQSQVPLRSADGAASCAWLSVSRAIHHPASSTAVSPWNSSVFPCFVV
ncbi:hypothetical protein OH77DRAFT_1428569 [Trametes cingulata]|nr:hypothetical protein OH77DRAFT_1428569 [Trametes cingulata]